MDVYGPFVKFFWEEACGEQRGPTHEDGSSKGVITPTEIDWTIAGINCDIVQTLGYVLKACKNSQEVRSTTPGSDYSKIFDKSKIVRAFPSKEGSSNALLLQEAGANYQLLEMVEMRTPGGGVRI